jgi:hypothetical protein
MPRVRGRELCGSGGVDHCLLDPLGSLYVPPGSRRGKARAALRSARRAGDLRARGPIPYTPRRMVWHHGHTASELTTTGPVLNDASAPVESASVSQGQ